MLVFGYVRDVLQHIAAAIWLHSGTVIVSVFLQIAISSALLLLRKKLIVSDDSGS